MVCRLDSVLQPESLMEYPGKDLTAEARGRDTSRVAS